MDIYSLLTKQIILKNVSQTIPHPSKPPIPIFSSPDHINWKVVGNSSIIFIYNLTLDNLTLDNLTLDNLTLDVNLSHTEHGQYSVRIH